MTRLIFFFFKLFVDSVHNQLLRVVHTHLCDLLRLRHDRRDHLAHDGLPSGHATRLALRFGLRHRRHLLLVRVLFRADHIRPHLAIHRLHWHEHHFVLHNLLVRAVRLSPQADLLSQGSRRLRCRSVTPKRQQ